MKNILKNKPQYLFLPWIVFQTFVLALVCRQLEPTLSRDGVLYLNMASVWQQSGYEELFAVFPDYASVLPLYIWAVKLLIGCGLSPETAGVGINMVTGSFIPVVTCLLTYELFKCRKAAFCAALLMSVNPSIIELMILPQREILYLFFCGLLIYFLTCGIKREKWYYFVIAGMFGALGALTRYETVEAVPIVLLALLFPLVKNIRLWKRQLLYFVLFICSLVFFLVVLTYITGVDGYIFKNCADYVIMRWRGLAKLVIDGMGLTK